MGLLYQGQGLLVHGKFTTKKALYACLVPKVKGGGCNQCFPPPLHSAASDFCHKYTVPQPQFLVDSRSHHCVHAPFPKIPGYSPPVKLNAGGPGILFRTKPGKAWSLLFADSADTLNSQLSVLRNRILKFQINKQQA